MSSVGSKKRKGTFGEEGTILGTLLGAIFQPITTRMCLLYLKDSKMVNGDGAE